ncbi:MAG: transcription termination/antitermination NusG family protein [Sedimentisphaerales bacterium]
MLKINENPAIIPPEVNSIAELNGTWRVAYTKSRFEKVFAREMLNRNIGYFLPMREKIIFSGGRKRHVMMPLFSSYVFFCGTEQDRYAAMTTGRLCHVIEVVRQESLIGELMNIEKAIFNNAVIDSYPGLAVGSNCRVKAGPMTGTEGVVIEKDMAKARMVIEVTILGQGVVVEIDNDLLEPL